MTLIIVYNYLGSDDPLTLIDDPNNNKTKHSCVLFMLGSNLGSSLYICRFDPLTLNGLKVGGKFS